MTTNLLNERHEAFCRYYASHFNATRAGEQVGYARATALTLITQDRITARIRELVDMQLKAQDITAERVMLELGRIAFADIRQIFDEQGALLPIHEIGDDAAAALAGIEIEQTVQSDGFEYVTDLITGKRTKQKRYKQVRIAKVKRYDKNSALTTLAKHYKIIGDEGDGINALASALGARLKGARERVQMVDEVPEAEQRVRVASDLIE